MLYIIEKLKMKKFGGILKFFIGVFFQIDGNC